uniref:(California timema) hypothetical protein n=1 Tax=Timema californicum TaxID=61474 RepID=A0A7R9J7G4_TIMCA|nr:unnamed protein product [Timema californicum]
MKQGRKALVQLHHLHQGTGVFTDYDAFRTEQINLLVQKCNDPPDRKPSSGNKILTMWPQGEGHRPPWGNPGWNPPPHGGHPGWHPPPHGGHDQHYPGPYVSWISSGSGDVPPGAVWAGKDSDGGDIYVGRASHEGDMLPAKVAPRHGGAFVSWGGEEHSKFSYELLITNPLTLSQLARTCSKLVDQSTSPLTLSQLARPCSMLVDQSTSPLTLSQLARPCSELVDQSPVSRPHLTLYLLGFNPTSTTFTKLLISRGKTHFLVLCCSNVAWERSSHGHVPYGAIEAGRTSSGEPLFIGRVLHNGTLTPGKEVNPHFRGRSCTKNHPSSSNRDSNLDLPILRSIAQHETSALTNYTTEAADFPETYKHTKRPTGRSDGQTGRQRDRQADRGTDRQTEGQSGKQKDSQANRGTDRQTEGQSGKQTGRQRDRTGKQTGGQKDSQADSRTARQTEL